MAKFNFKLQNVLDIKEKLESQQKIEYSLANARLAEEQQKLKDLLIRRGEYESKFKDSQTGDLDLKEISFYKNAIDTMKSLIRTQMFALKKAEEEAERQRQILDEMMKDRKTFEKLKEHAFENFKKEIAAEESKAIDGLVSFTYGIKG